MPADCRARPRERPAVRAEKLFGENAVQRRPATTGLRDQPDGVGISGTIKASDPIRTVMEQLGPAPLGRRPGAQSPAGADRQRHAKRVSSSPGGRIYNQKPLSANALRLLSPSPPPPRREFVTDLRSPVKTSALEKRHVSHAQPLMMEQGRKLAPFSKTGPKQGKKTKDVEQSTLDSFFEEAGVESPAAESPPAPPRNVIFSANTTIGSEAHERPGSRRNQRPRQTAVDRHMVGHGQAHFSPRDVTQMHRQQSSNVTRQPPRADVLIRGPLRTYAEVRPHSTSGVFGFNTQTGSFLRTLVSPELAEAGVAPRRVAVREPSFTVENETHTTTVHWPGEAGADDSSPDTTLQYYRPQSSLGGSMDSHSPFPVHDRLSRSGSAVATRPASVNSRRGSRSRPQSKGRRGSGATGAAALEGKVIVPDRPRTALHQSFSEVAPWDS